jgi:hypothetical protein
LFLVVVGTEQFIGVGAGLLLVVPGFIIRCSDALESLGSFYMYCWQWGITSGYSLVYSWLDSQHLW